MMARAEATATLSAHAVHRERLRAFALHLDGAGAWPAPEAVLAPWLLDAFPAAQGAGLVAVGGAGVFIDRRVEPVRVPRLPEWAADAAGVHLSANGRAVLAAPFCVTDRRWWLVVLGRDRSAFDEADTALAEVIAGCVAPCLSLAEETPPPRRRRAVAEALQIARFRAAGDLPAEVVVESAPFRAALCRTLGLARHGLATLLLGETGTGKEVLARAWHAASPRRGGPFIAVNCAALPAELAESLLFGHVRGAFTGAVEATTGFIEAARDGVLFLDEIGDLPAVVQAKLLRALDGHTRKVGEAGPERPIALCLVAATNRAVDAPGRLRADLLARLGTKVVLAPLRERPEDVAALAEWHVRRLARAHGFAAEGLTEAAVATLCELPLSHNARELARLVAEAFALRLDPDATHVDAHHLVPAEAPTSPATLAEQLAVTEARLVSAAIARHETIAAAARAVGDRDQTFRKRVARLERDGWLASGK